MSRKTSFRQKKVLNHDFWRTHFLQSGKSCKTFYGRNLQIFVICQGQTLYLTGPICELQTKWSAVNKNPEAVFLVVCDPSMNKLWASSTHRDLCIDLSRSLTEGSHMTKNTASGLQDLFLQP